MNQVHAIKPIYGAPGAFGVFQKNSLSHALRRGATAGVRGRALVAAASFQAAGVGLGDVGTARAGTVLAAAVEAGAGLEAAACAGGLRR